MEPKILHIPKTIVNFAGEVVIATFTSPRTFEHIAYNNAAADYMQHGHCEFSSKRQIKNQISFPSAPNLRVDC